MELTTWIAAGYFLVLPASYQLDVQQVEDRSGWPGIVKQTTCVWKTALGDSINFSWWAPMPAHPGGRMVAARTVDGSWGGKPAKFVETAIFEGTEMKVSAAFQQHVDPRASARVVATALDLETLTSLLGRSSLREVLSDRPSTEGCRATDSDTRLPPS